MGLLIGIASTTITSTGLILVHRRWSQDLRRQHNDIAGFVIAVVGVIYAVLVASVAVMAWGAYGDAEKIVDREGMLVVDVYTDVTGLDEDVGAIVRNDLISYTQTVIDVEWSQMRQELPHDQARHFLTHIEKVLAQYQPQTASQQVYLRSILSRMNKLHDARHARLALMDEYIPPVIWTAVILGGLITISYTYFFGLKSIRVHLLMSNGLALMIALVITIIAAMDHPFLGDVNISSVPFQIALEHMRPGGG